jgi:UDP-N-acetylglucosamine 3-dehydrogenase
LSFKIGVVGVEQHAPYLFSGMEASDKLDFVGYVGEASDRAIFEKHVSQKSVPVYSTVEDLVEQQDPDIIGISTISSDQGPEIVKAIELGKHVITDKPLLTTREDLERVKAVLASNRDLRVSMMLTLRDSPQYQGLRRAVQHGDIGDVVNCYAKRSATLRPQGRPPWAFVYEQSGGPILDLVIHDIDAVSWITQLGYVSTVSYQGNVNGHARGSFYDHSQSLLIMDGGASLAVEGHRNVPESYGGMDNRMTIVGTRGHIECSSKGPVLQFSDSVAGEVIDLPEPRHIVVDFADALEEGTDPTLTTDELMRLMDVCLGVKEASESGARVDLTG